MSLVISRPFPCRRHVKHLPYPPWNWRCRGARLRHRQSETVDQCTDSSAERKGPAQCPYCTDDRTSTCICPIILSAWPPADLGPFFALQSIAVSAHCKCRGYIDHVPPFVIEQTLQNAHFMAPRSKTASGSASQPTKSELLQEKEKQTENKNAKDMEHRQAAPPQPRGFVVENKRQAGGDASEGRARRR